MFRAMDAVHMLRMQSNDASIEDYVFAILPRTVDVLSASAPIDMWIEIISHIYCIVGAVSTGSRLKCGRHRYCAAPYYHMS